MRDTLSHLSFGENIMQLYRDAIMSDDGLKGLSSLHDVPLWVWIVLGFAGICGEAWRASNAPPITVRSILERVILRSGAGMLFGVATGLMVLEYSGSFGYSIAAGIIVSLMGAEVASGVYERWIMRKAGISKDE